MILFFLYLSNFDTMIYNKYWLIFAVTFLVLLILVYLIWPRSKFVIPSQNINTNKKIIFKSVIYIFIISTWLFFVNIWRISNKTVVKQKNLNIQVILDVSLSMAGKDIEPSRFNLAKKSLVYLFSELSWYNMSLITFSGKPFVYIPYTNDYIASIAKLQDTELADFYPTMDFVWTAMWDAMLLGLKNSLEIQKKWSDGLDTIFILITDGDTNGWNNPYTILDQIIKNDIVVFGIWIWEWSLVIWKDKFGNNQPASFNTTLLRQISRQTGWEFYNAKKPEDFDDIFVQIKNMIKNSENKKVVLEYNYLNKYLIIIIILCLLSILFFYWKKIEKL